MSQAVSDTNALIKSRAPRNQTIEIKSTDRKELRRRLKTVSSAVKLNEILNSTIHGDILEVASNLPDEIVDILFLDPPYNLNKSFNGRKFNSLTSRNYESLLDKWIAPLVRLLKPTASIYVCGDWRSSAALYNVCSKYFKIQNRITWEREKGRGAKSNWKNCTEDIWYCTRSDKFVFNLESVKLNRAVIAPYRDSNGQPKDWQETPEGSFRTTAPSNIWTDITVPFWSMSENTDHPTQKPEKLLAKIILASSDENDLVFDPFAGSGTTSVAAKKLNRNYIAVERELEYCLLTEKRLLKAEKDKTIQGYRDNIFWERNCLKRSLNK